MTTEWIRKHVKPSLVSKYEQEMNKLRGETSSIGHIVDNIAKMNNDSEQIESEVERRARELAEDEADIRYQEQLKQERKK
jgi:hypothetical protein